MIDEMFNVFRGWYIDDVRVATRGSVRVTRSDAAWSIEGPEGGPFSPGATILTLDLQSRDKACHAAPVS